MKVLAVDKDGKEHALVHAVNRSDRIKEIYAAPGNPGMAELARCVNIAGSDVKGLTAFVKKQEIDLTIIGPKAMLSLGIVDTFQAEGLKIFGPTRDAAQVESSKDFAKKIMAKCGIPITSYQTFGNKVDTIGYMEHQGVPIVMEEDGLKAEKGVMIAYELKEALDATEIASSVPGDRVVIEECPGGFEFSSICFVCDDLVLPMEVVQDHKVAYDDDKGPNTGGVGVYSPVRKITPDIIGGTMNAVMMPMAKTMVKEGYPFTGFLCGGLILTEHGVRTIEFNTHFGDPEAEVILPGLKTDFCNVIENIMDHSKTELKWDDRITLDIVMASEGYPASNTKGAMIENLENMNSMVFHMGTAEKEGSLVTGGGCVLCVCAAADALEEVYGKTYTNVHRIHHDKLFYRDDIGKKDM